MNNQFYTELDVELYLNGSMLEVNLSLSGLETIGP